MSPGATVIIIGCGAGGEIAACINKGINCIAIDTDTVQLEAVAKWLTIRETDQAQEREQQQQLQGHALKIISNPPPSADTICTCFCCGMKLCIANEAIGQDKCVDCVTYLCQNIGCGLNEEETYDAGIGLRCDECKIALLKVDKQSKADAAAAPELDVVGP